MKQLSFVLLTAILVLSGCGKKTLPTKSLLEQESAYIEEEMNDSELDVIMSRILALPEFEEIENPRIIVREPTEIEPYYVLQLGNNVDDHFATHYWFHAYSGNDIRHWDPAANIEMTLRGAIIDNSLEESELNTIISVISELPEVKSLINPSIMIAGEPTNNKPYYIIQVGQKNRDRFITHYWFHAYNTLDIRFWDVVENRETTLNGDLIEESLKDPDLDKILSRILELPEIKKIVNPVVIISSEPTDSDPYYILQVGNKNNKAFISNYWFRVYSINDIRFWDIINDVETTTSGKVIKSK